VNTTDHIVAGPATRNLTFKTTISLIKADVRRRLILEEMEPSLWNAVAIALKPGLVCVVLYRICNFLYHKKYRIVARVIDDAQYLYTGVEIAQGSVIGPGLVFGDGKGGGTVEWVTIGMNCTMLGGAAMTLNAAGDGLSKGGIVIGDNCIIGLGVRIVGAVTLADCTQIKPNAVVLNSSSVPGAVLEGIPARRTGVVPIEAVMRWNPLKSVFLSAQSTYQRQQSVT
jgi:serine O-acetyltransferase